jgi:hypothetical protein
MVPITGTISKARAFQKGLAFFFCALISLGKFSFGVF